jgi:glycerol-3-phosphate O-acyltransferase
VETGVVSCFDEGPEPVYVIGPEQHLTAAYYRNTVIHFFVNGAIVELALIYATSVSEADAREAFWEEAMRLRDLLKFEFFFTDKDEFRRELHEELAHHHPEWEAGLAGGVQAIETVVRSIRPFTAHRVLRPFLDAYAIAADVLEGWEVESPVEAGRFESAALALGRQYALQKRIKSPESVSKVLFQTALRLARNRGLVDPAIPDVSLRRRAFALEIRDVVRRIEAVEALAASRRAGLID